MAAFEFALQEFPGKRILFMVALVALMVPSIVVLIPTYLLVVRLGWLNTIQGLAIPGLASAFGLVRVDPISSKNLPANFLTLHKWTAPTILDFTGILRFLFPKTG